MISTAIALWMVFGRRKSVTIRLAGVAAFVLPHAIGAPVAVGRSSIPVELIHRFILLSILTTGYSGFPWVPSAVCYIIVSNTPTRRNASIAKTIDLDGNGVLG